MSLINQMLRDLENRRSQRPSFDVPLIDLRAAKISTLIEKWFDYRLGIFISCCVLFLLISLFKVFFGHHAEETINNNPASALNSTGAESSLIGIFSNHQANLFQKNSTTNSGEVNLARLQDFKVTRNGDITHVSLSFDKATLYNLESEEESKITLTLDHAGLQKTITPSDYIDSAIQDITVASNAEGELALTFHVPSDAVVKSLNSFDGSQHIITLDIVSSSANIANQNEQSTPIASSTPSSTEKPLEISSFSNVKKITAPSEGELVNQKLQSIMELVNRGQVEVAIRLLRNLIVKNPTFLPAQESLAILLGQNGSIVEAVQILDNARTRFGNDSSLLKLEAELLTKQGKSQEALTLLSTINRPSLQRDPEYYALVASLQERDGKFQEARQVYEQLVEYKPENSVWWVGLGIALENLGKHDAALNAYNHAAQNGNLSPELLAYVSDQLGSSATS